MTRINSYLKDNMLLIKSLIFKLTDLALHINRELEETYKIEIDYDKRETWKYYLNISGEYHMVDIPMEIYIPYLDKTLPYTKETLEEYPDVRDELLKFDYLYNSLLEKYPHQELLIRGILLPIDINKAINAENGTILNYNKDLVEEQESYLIPELDLYIKNLLARWNVKEFAVTDELYVAALIMQITNLLIPKLLNLRLSKVLTYEAHSFHIDEFFRSHFNILDDVKFLSKKTKFWLYKNIRYIERNLGKESTLRLIIDKLLTPNKIGVGDLTILQKDAEELKDKLLDKSTSIYNKEEQNILMFKGRNDSFYTIENESIKPEELLILENNNEEITSDILTEEDDIYINKLKSSLIKNNLHLQNTKILMIDNVRIRKMNPINLVDLTLDTWIYLSFKNKYIGKRLFIDPNTNRQYYLTPKDGVILFMYLLSKLLKIDSEHFKIYRYFNIVYENITEEYLLENLVFPNDLKPYVKVLNEVKPISKTIYKKDEDIKDYINKVIKYYDLVWLMTSNSNNVGISGDLKTIDTKIRRPGKLDLNLEDKSLEDHLLDSGIEIEIFDNYNYIEILNKLIYEFTGIIVDETLEIKEIMNRYRKLVNKFTAYTTQVIFNKSDDEKINTFFNSIMTMNMTDTIGSVNRARFKCLEDFYGLTVTFGNDQIEILKGVIAETILNIENKCMIQPIVDFSFIANKPIEVLSVGDRGIYSNIIDKCIELYTPTIKTVSDKLKERISPAKLFELMNDIANFFITADIPVSKNKLEYLDTNLVSIPNKVIELYRPETKSKASDITEVIANTDLVDTFISGLFSKLLITASKTLEDPIEYNELSNINTSIDNIIDLYRPTIKNTANDLTEKEIISIKDGKVEELDIFLEKTLLTGFSEDSNEINFIENNELTSIEKYTQLDIPKIKSESTDKRDIIENYSITEIELVNIFKHLLLAEQDNIPNPIIFKEDEVLISNSEFIELSRPRIISKLNNLIDSIDFDKNEILKSIKEEIITNYVSKQNDIEDPISHLEDEVLVSKDEYLDLNKVKIDTESTDKVDIPIFKDNNTYSKNDILIKEIDISKQSDIENPITFIEDETLTSKEEIVAKYIPETKGKADTSKNIIKEAIIDIIENRLFKPLLISRDRVLIKDIDYETREIDSVLSDLVELFTPKTKVNSNDIIDIPILEDTISNIIDTKLNIENNFVSKQSDIENPIIFIEDESLVSKDEYLDKNKIKVKSEIDNKEERLTETNTDETGIFKPITVGSDYDDVVNDEGIQEDWIPEVVIEEIKIED